MLHFLPMDDTSCPQRHFLTMKRRLATYLIHPKDFNFQYSHDCSVVTYLFPLTKLERMETAFFFFLQQQQLLLSGGLVTLPKMQNATSKRKIQRRL